MLNLEPSAKRAKSIGPELQAEPTSNAHNLVPGSEESWRERRLEEVVDMMAETQPQSNSESLEQSILPESQVEKVPNAQTLQPTPEQPRQSLPSETPVEKPSNRQDSQSSSKESNQNITPQPQVKQIPNTQDQTLPDKQENVILPQPRVEQTPVVQKPILQEKPDNIPVQQPPKPHVCTQISIYS